MLGSLLWLCFSACTWAQANGKWVEGHLNTKENWAFLARFCFLSLDGQFEYSIEFDRTVGTPNLLLYYDDDSQWPSVYHSDKTCKEREAVLNKAGQNQVIPLSHWYPDTELSGCVLRSADRDLPATKSSTTTAKPTVNFTTTRSPQGDKLNQSKRPTEDPSYYHQFLKPTTKQPTTDSSNVTWYEIRTTMDINETSTDSPEDSMWEDVASGNGSEMRNDLKDVEMMFGNADEGNHKKIKRSFEISERMKRRRLNSGPAGGGEATGEGKLVVYCHNARRFRSARERWWFIAVSNCDSPNGLDIRYRFLMTNGVEGDFWHEHFSADEFYVLPVLLAYTLAYLTVLLAVAMCSVELKTRHLLHTTYKLFVVSVVAQQCGILFMSLAYSRYAVNGIGNEGVKIVGQFMCGISEMTFLLVLVLMAKGYTITRARLRVSFTVKLTVFMCTYFVTYILLFVYQAKSFDPGAVLYLYESPAGYGSVVLRILAWFMFVYATVFTVKKFPEKTMFYCPFSICGSMWFYAGPLFILTANSYVDKWVRESVVTAVLLFISFAGHIAFLLLTLPVFANKNFPYHVRTTQIGIMEVAGGDGFGAGMYRPSEPPQPQTVIIPLTRRTEELIGSMYNQFMASAPPLSLEDVPKQNGAFASDSPKTLVQQVSSDSSVEIQPNTGVFTNPDDTRILNGTVTNNPGNERASNNNGISDKRLNKKVSENTSGTGKLSINGFKSSESTSKENGIFSIDSQMAKGMVERKNSIPNGHNSLESLPHNSPVSSGYRVEEPEPNLSNPMLMSANLKARRNLLEPIGLKEAPLPSWSFAKSSAKKDVKADNDTAAAAILSAGGRESARRNGLRQPPEISTIHEQHEHTVDLFAAGRK